GGKITGRLLAKAMAATLRQIRKARDAPGRQSFKQLAKGGTLQNIEIADENIKAFEPVARKYGIRYKLVKDASETPPKWMVFFRAKDADAMTAAFREFASITLKRETTRPSVREAMAKFREVLKNAVIDRTRHKHREGPER
ncbi:PcfB family protein, partial [Eubacteriales bacterium OttesenSCG-928-K08]|nr:PcfB family protein [Eubacteriales bacterium OttesenSCG-928-K08]